ncbi:hypothetical protein TRVA0_070S00298 [Trichomonascus vanleenenianus]|uniref:uncharacterized protein n=1 Tax=Trichomonascus vanleenenianus TaxID=2268995 RepID=UPI003ECA0BB4
MPKFTLENPSGAPRPGKNKTMNFLKELYFAYSIEVFPVYMMTKNETKIVNTVAAILLALFTVTFLGYLPYHVQQMSRRMYYYVTGGDVSSLAAF